MFAESGVEKVMFLEADVLMGKCGDQDNVPIMAHPPEVYVCLYACNTYVRYSHVYMCVCVYVCMIDSCVCG